jgi:hypothetical protein
MQAFVSKPVEARSPEFKSPVMPQSVRLFQSTVPGPEARYAFLMILKDPFSRDVSQVDSRYF